MRELRDMLTGLACGQPLPNGYRAGGFIEWLQDEALGNTRKGESARRSTEKGSPMMHNEHASTLLTQLHAMLTTWVTHLCGTEVSTTSTTTAAAIWLANNIPTIACNEAAGQIFTQIRKAIDDIEYRINRPIPAKYCGACPTLNADQKPCAIPLYAKRRDDIEVYCWKCKTTHNVEQLIQRRLNETPYLLFTARDVLRIMGQIGEAVNERTWRHWRAKEWVLPRGELYGKPGYWLEDVRQLRRGAHVS